MAYLSISGNNASYTLTLSGMSTSLRYHVFVADLTSTGGINGYKCLRSGWGTSSSWKYSGSSGSPYSNYDRGVYVRSTTAETIHHVGTVYEYDQVFETTKEVTYGNIPAASGGGGTTYTTNPIYFRTGTGIHSYTMEYANSTSTGNEDEITGRDTSTTIFVRDGTNAKLSTLSYESDYGLPYYFKEYTNSSFSTVKKTFSNNDGQVYSSGTRYIKLFATYNEPTQYTINLRTGIGVSNYSVKYTLASGKIQTAVINNPSVSTTCFVKANTDLEITSVNYATDYEAPFNLHRYNSSFSEVLENYSDNYKYINANSNKYFKLSGTYRPQRTISLYANGGFYQDGGTQSTVKQVKKKVGQTLELKTYSDLLSNTDNDYEFLGWSMNPSADSPEYGKYSSVTITSTMSETPTFYAIWGRIFYVKCGTGVQRIKFSDGVRQPTETSNQSFQKVILKANNPTITMTLTAFSGYSAPFKYYYQPNEGGQITGSSKFTGSLSYTWNSSRKYVTIDAQKILTKFYWCGSDEQDNIKIAKDQPVTNLTAASWNNLKDTITELGAGLEITASPGTYVASGAQITAAEFNKIRAAIRQLSSTALLPAEVKSGDTIKASYFNGGGSLKSAINWIIDQYNS